MTSSLCPVSQKRREQDMLIGKRLGETVFYVEATSFEKLTLWQAWHDRISWEQVDPGFVETVGHLDGRPVNIVLHWDRIGGCMVLFWNACSQVVDHAMIDEWFRQNPPPMWDGDRRRGSTDAMNFHYCILAIEEKTGRKVRGRDASA